MFTRPGISMHQVSGSPGHHGDFFAAKKMIPVVGMMVGLMVSSGLTMVNNG